MEARNVVGAVEQLMALLREIIRGKAEIRPVGSTWHEVHAGDVTFDAGGWRLVFFNDSDDLDYLDSFTTPEGLRFEFDDMRPLDESLPQLEPVRFLLSYEESDRLLSILRAAEPRSVRLR